MRIVPENPERIFRMFEQIHPVKEFEGAGLAIECNAVERLSASSELGKGKGKNISDENL